MKSLSKILIIITFISLIVIISSLFYIMSNSIINFSRSNVSLSTDSEKASPIYYIDLYGENYDKYTTVLDLSNVTVDNELTLLLEDFPMLENVIIKNQSLPQELQFNLEELYPNIKFEWNVSVLNKSISNGIENLDLSKEKINNIDSFKKSLELLHNLRYLDMSDCNLSNEELAKLRDYLPNTKVVWRIYLGKWSLKTDDVAFSVLITKYDYKRMKSSDIEVLKYCTDLQALDLGHQNITDISVIGDYLPNLRILILADNKITDITPISKLKHLHYLELFMNNITDISPLVSCKELVDLNLAHIKKLNDFSPLINNDFPLLERLWIENSGGTKKYYDALKEKYKNTTIIYTGYGSTHSGWRTHPRYYAMIDMFNKRNYISDLFTIYDDIIVIPIYTVTTDETLL